MKTPAAKPPQLQTEMTHLQFCKIKMDWNVFKQITNMPPNQLHSQLYSSCTDTVQTGLVNTVNNFCELTEAQLLETLEQIITKNLTKLQLTSPI